MYVPQKQNPSAHATQRDEVPVRGVCGWEREVTERAETAYLTYVREYGAFLSTSLFLGSLGSRLGNLAATSNSLLNSLDDTDSDGLTHVANGETP